MILLKQCKSRRYLDELILFVLASGAVIHACYFTNWENNWDGMLDYIVPTHKVLRGMDSYHSNTME